MYLFTSSSDMKRFILKIVLFAIPIAVLFVGYVLFDPLKVIWDYDDYTKTRSVNVAYNSYKIMTKGDTIPFNSFIVGSSRSGFWPWKEWEKHLDSTACAFHLESSGDGVYNALERLLYVYANAEQVDNILLIIDQEWLQKTKPLTGIQFRTPWQMRKSKDWLVFNADAIRYLLSIDGFKATFKIGQRYNDVFQPYRDERNENFFPGKEEMITNDPQNYYAYMIDETVKLYPRTSKEQIGSPSITNLCIDLLSELHKLFLSGNTDYKIVISPLYDQVKLNPADKSILDSIFGPENVYDFSGINQYTSDTLNYYEASHYRPHVAVQMLNEIYTKEVKVE